MARTTAELVKGVLLRDYDSQNNPDLSAFIDSAAMIIDQVVLCVARKGLDPLSSSHLEIMERWLAAHSYAMNDPQYSEKQTGRSKGVFLGKKDVLGLDGSRYGQYAKSLDPTGCLCAVTEGKRPKAYWLGLPPSEQTNVQDRD